MLTWPDDLFASITASLARTMATLPPVVVEEADVEALATVAEVDSADVEADVEVAEADLETVVDEVVAEVGLETVVAEVDVVAPPTVEALATSLARRQPFKAIIISSRLGKPMRLSSASLCERDLQSGHMSPRCLALMLPDDHRLRKHRPKLAG